MKYAKNKIWWLGIMVLLMSTLVPGVELTNYSDSVFNNASWTSGSEYGTCTSGAVSLVDIQVATTAFLANNYTSVATPDVAYMSTLSSGTNVDPIQRYFMKVNLTKVVSSSNVDWLQVKWTGKKTSCAGSSESGCCWIANWTGGTSVLFNSAITTTNANYTTNYTKSSAVQLINATDGRVIVACMCDEGDSGGPDGIDTDYIELLYDYTIPEALNITSFSVTNDSSTTAGNWTVSYTSTGASGGNYTWFNGTSHPVYVVSSFDAENNNGLDLTGVYGSTLTEGANEWTYTTGKNGSGAYDINSLNTGSGECINYSWTTTPTAPFFVEMSFKMKYNAAANNMALIGQYSTNPVARMWQILINGSNHIRTLTSDDGTRTDAVVNASIALVKDQWYHLVWIYNSTHTKMYLNNTLIANVDRTYDGIYAGNQPLRIGAWWATTCSNQGNFTYDHFQLGGYEPDTVQITEWYNAWLAGRNSKLMAETTDYPESWNAWLAASNVTTSLKSNFNFSIAATSNVTDSCTYTSGDWNVNLADNCIVTTTVNVYPNKLLLTGSGNFTIASGGEVICKEKHFTPTTLNGNNVFARLTGSKLTIKP